MVPIKEMVDVLKVVRAVSGIKRGSWVRIKRGMFKDDIARVSTCCMCVCICCGHCNVCYCVCIYRVYIFGICMRISTHNIPTNMHTCLQMYICINIRAYVLSQLYMHVCIYIHYIDTHACRHIHIHIKVYVKYYYLYVFNAG